jgi:hypothetical protein
LRLAPRIDRHLLKLKEYEGTAVVTLAVFLQRPAK